MRDPTFFTTLGFFSRAVIVGSEVLALAVEQKTDSATASSILEGTTYSSPSSCSIWALLEKKIAFASPGTLLYHDADLKNLVLVLGSAIQLYERKTEGSLTYTAVSRHKAGAFIPVRALLVEENGDKLLIYLGLSNQRTLTESASSLYVSKTNYKSPARLARMFYGCCVFNLTKNQLISERITPIKRKSPVLDLLYNAHSSTVVIKYLNHSAEPLMLTIDLNNSYTLWRSRVKILNTLHLMAHQYSQLDVHRTLPILFTPVSLAPSQSRRLTLCACLSGMGYILIYLPAT